jgi:hypothetical protein
MLLYISVKEFSHCKNVDLVIRYKVTSFSQTVNNNYNIFIFDSIKFALEKLDHEINSYLLL